MRLHTPFTSMCLDRNGPLAASWLLLLATCTVFAGPSPDAKPPREWARQVEFANALVERGALQEAEATYTAALSDARADHDEMRAGVVLYNLGKLRDRQGHSLQAEKAFRQAVVALTRTGTMDRRLVLRAYAGLCSAYLQTGQYSKAEALLRRIEAEDARGTIADEASLMGIRGIVLMRKGRFDEAEQVLRQTVEVTGRNQRPEMQEVRAVALANLAMVQLHAGRIREALASFAIAIGILEGLPNPSPAALVVAIAEYAHATRISGDRQTAADLYRRAMAVADARLGRAHPTVAGLLQGYAELMQSYGRQSEARTLATAAREIRKRTERENLLGQTIDVESLHAGK